MTSKTPETVTSKEHKSEAPKMDASPNTDICTTPVVVHQQNDTIFEEGDVVADAGFTSPDDLISLDQSVIGPSTTATPQIVKYRPRDTIFATPMHPRTESNTKMDTVDAGQIASNDGLIRIDDSTSNSSKSVWSNLRVSSIFKSAFASPADASPAAPSSATSSPAAPSPALPSPAAPLQSQTSNCSVITISSVGSEIPNPSSIDDDDDKQVFEMTLSSLNDDDVAEFTEDEVNELNDTMPTSLNATLTDSDVENGEFRVKSD